MSIFKKISKIGISETSTIPIWSFVSLLWRYGKASPSKRINISKELLSYADNIKENGEIKEIMAIMDNSLDKAEAFIDFWSIFVTSEKGLFGYDDENFWWQKVREIS